MVAYGKLDIECVKGELPLSNNHYVSSFKVKVALIVMSICSMEGLAAVRHADVLRLPIPRGEWKIGLCRCSECTLQPDSADVGGDLEMLHNVRAIALGCFRHGSLKDWNSSVVFR